MNITVTTDPDLGKCKSCGFLVKRTKGGINQPPQVDYEATPQERSSPPYFFVRCDERAIRVPVDFACFRDVIDLSDSYSQIDDETEKTTAAMLMLDNEDLCDYWYSYKRGVSPVKHYEWSQEESREYHRERSEEMKEERRREYEEKLLFGQRQFESALAINASRSQEERDIAAASGSRVMKRLTYAALVFAAAEVLTLTNDSLLAKAAVWVWHRIFG